MAKPFPRGSPRPDGKAVRANGLRTALWRETGPAPWGWTRFTRRSVRGIFPDAHVNDPFLSAAIGGGSQEGAPAPSWTLPGTVGRGTGDPRWGACFCRGCLLSGSPRSGIAGGRAAAAAGRETGAGALLRARGREMRVRKEAGTGLVPASLKVDGSAGGSAYFFARWSARAILATWPLRTSRASRLGMTMRPLNMSLMSQTRLTFWTEPTTMKTRAMRA